MSLKRRQPNAPFRADLGAASLKPSTITVTPGDVVQIGSPSTRGRDETIKKRLYERMAVEEYWFVDPEVDTMRVYRRGGERFARAVELSTREGDVLTTALLPGFELPLAQVFEES